MKKVFTAFCFFLFASCFAGEGKRVYVDIVGDLFHAGHVEFLKKAKSFGDTLIVGVLADEVVQEYKRGPVMSLSERVKVIEACRYVDEIVVAPPLRLTDEMIDDLRIDYVVHGDDHDDETKQDQYAVALRRGIFRSVPYTQGVSTTNIIGRIVGRFQLGDFQAIARTLELSSWERSLGGN